MQGYNANVFSRTANEMSVSKRGLTCIWRILILHIVSCFVDFFRNLQKRYLMCFTRYPLCLKIRYSVVYPYTTPIECVPTTRHLMIYWTSLWD